MGSECLIRNEYDSWKDLSEAHPGFLGGIWRGLFPTVSQPEDMHIGAWSPDSVIDISPGAFRRFLLSEKERKRLYEVGDEWLLRPVSRRVAK